MGKLQVVAGSGSVFEGRYYKEQDEDGDHVVFDYCLAVEGVDGKHYTHYLGHRFCSDAEALLRKVEAAGVVDLDYWEAVLEQPSLEERYLRG